jgi:two-component system response regulator ChvI
VRFSSVSQLSIDEERHTCTWKNHTVTLTVTEFLLLKALASRPGVVKSRNALMDAAYDDQVYVDDELSTVTSSGCRRNFGKTTLKFDMIETLYGIGYRFKEAEPTSLRTSSRLDTTLRCRRRP